MSKFSLLIPDSLKEEFGFPEVACSGATFSLTVKSVRRKERIAAIPSGVAAEKQMSLIWLTRLGFIAPKEESNGY